MRNDFRDISMLPPRWWPFGGLMRYLICANLLLWASPAAAADYVLNIQAGANQESRYEDGREAVTSESPASSVRIYEPRDRTPKRSGFRVLILNNGEQPVNFGPENVTVVLPSGERVAMVTYERLVREQENREMWQGIAAGLAAASRNMNAANAGHSYTSGTYSGSSYGTFGSTPYQAQTQGFGTAYTYDAGKAAIAQSLANEQNRRDFEALEANRAAAREQLEGVMKTTTVDPGRVFGGIVQYDVPKVVRSAKAALPVVVEVYVGTEVHRFSATLGKYKKQ